jgi:two-component system, NarL family, nitrate/nitrite response regulator NarL
MKRLHQAATVLVADGHAVVRAGVRHILETATNISIVAESSDACTAFNLCLQHKPDLIILDISTPNGSGLEVLPKLRQHSPKTRIIAFSVHCDIVAAEESIRAGAHGYVLKNTTASELCSAISTVLAGQNYFSAELTDQAISRRTPTGQLTSRERQILSRIALGQTSKQIAEDFGISRRTVETHRESMSKKLGISTVAGLTRYAIENGIVGQNE